MERWALRRSAGERASRFLPSSTRASSGFDSAAIWSRLIGGAGSPVRNVFVPMGKVEARSRNYLLDPYAADIEYQRALKLGGFASRGLVSLIVGISEEKAPQRMEPGG